MIFKTKFKASGTKKQKESNFLFAAIDESICFNEPDAAFLQFAKRGFFSLSSLQLI